MAEDDPALRWMLTAALQRSGLPVVTAADGAAALSHIVRERDRDRPIAVLLADVVMPRMSGYEIAERATASSPDLRVVFTTGYHDVEAPPGAALLQKPFSLETLVTAVREQLLAS